MKSVTAVRVVAAPTAVIVTSVTPTSRAEAVAAARAGLRTALSIANRPAGPKGRAATKPMPRAAAGTRTLPAMITPVKETSPPMTPTATEGRVPDRTSAPAPTAMRTSPMAMRTRPPRLRAVVAASGRSAASGATREDRTTGRSAATSTTSTPTTTGTATARTGTVKTRSGSASPASAPPARVSPQAIAMPVMTPTTEKRTPTTSDSARADRMT